MPACTISGSTQEHAIAPKQGDRRRRGAPCPGAGVTCARCGSASETSPPALWLVYDSAEPHAIVGTHDEPDDEAEAVIEAAQADLLLGERILVAARRAAAQRARLRHDAPSRRRAPRSRA